MAATEGPAARTSALRPRTTARLVGLEKHPDLNGQLCELLRPGDGGRWVVATTLGEKAVLPERLRVGHAAVPSWMRRVLGCGGAGTLLLLFLVAGPAAAPLVPAAAMIWLLATLACCYWLHLPLLDPAVPVPAISEMGAALPADGVYRFGFAVVGLLLAATIRLYDGLLMARLAEDAPDEADSPGGPTLSPSTSVLFGYLAAAGVVVQGLFTLQNKFTQQTFLHFVGAIFFIIGAMKHASASNALLSGDRGAPLRRDPLAQRSLALRRASADYGPAALMVVPLVLQAVKRILPTASSGEPGGGVQTAMGVVQWCLVLNFAAFFCSYAIDFCAVAAG